MSTTACGPTSLSRRARSRSLVLVGGALVVGAALAFGGVALMNAWFTSSASVAGQDVSTATVDISAGVTGTGPVLVGGLVPGDQQTTTITVTNTGSADVYFSLGTFHVTGDDVLLSKLSVTAVDLRDGSSSGAHTLAAWSDRGAYENGVFGARSWKGLSLAAGASADIEVTVELPASITDKGDPATTVQAKSVAVSYEFQAVQQRNYTGTTTPTWSVN